MNMHSLGIVLIPDLIADDVVQSAELYAPWRQWTRVCSGDMQVLVAKWKSPVTQSARQSSRRQASLHALVGVFWLSRLAPLTPFAPP